MEKKQFKTLRRVGPSEARWLRSGQKMTIEPALTDLREEGGGKRYTVSNVSGVGARVIEKEKQTFLHPGWNQGALF